MNTDNIAGLSYCDPAVKNNIDNPLNAKNDTNNGVMENFSGKNNVAIK